MKHFKYSIEDLIREIRERPVIWDKTLEIYKDREERKTAWEEIFRILEEDFNDLSKIEKRSIADIITTKWTNVRDTFTRSLKNQSTKSGVRRYVYHDEMSFLLKVVPQEIVPEYEASDEDPMAHKSMKQEAIQDESEDEAALPEEIQETRHYKKYERKRKYIDMETEPRSHRKRSKKSRQAQSEPDESPVMEYETEDPRIMNEDEAFFASLLPSVVKYSESERLEFRIEVLAVMKNINEKRRRND